MHFWVTRYHINQQRLKTRFAPSERFVVAKTGVNRASLKLPYMELECLESFEPNIGDLQDFHTRI